MIATDLPSEPRPEAKRRWTRSCARGHARASLASQFWDPTRDRKGWAPLLLPVTRKCPGPARRGTPPAPPARLPQTAARQPRAEGSPPPSLFPTPSLPRAPSIRGGVCGPVARHLPLSTHALHTAGRRRPQPGRPAPHLSPRRLPGHALGPTLCFQLAEGRGGPLLLAPGPCSGGSPSPPSPSIGRGAGRIGPASLTIGRL